MWVSSNVRNLVVQAKLRTDMKEQNKKKIVDVIWSLAVIDQAFLLRNLVALIIVTEGSNYRSKLTTFIIGHAMIQVLTLFNTMYKELIVCLKQMLN